MFGLEAYEYWLKHVKDPELLKDLQSISGNYEEIDDRFYRDLSFGTAGLRGVLGAGSNRMNIYTVGRATQGLADYLRMHYVTSSVAISYDSRIKSDEFARLSAEILAGNGIHVYIMPELMPTPVLSFAVRYFGCQSGIMITASHNPSKYNGYKCYSPEGGQMTEEAAGEVMGYIQGHEMFDDVKKIDFTAGLKQGLIEYIKDEVLEAFLQNVLANQVHPGVCEGSELKVIYTPLNGTGNKPVREVLKRIGMKNITVVSEQELPDGNFPTCSYPNPEFPESFERALKLAESVPADILLATDPDCDRVAFAARKDDGSYQFLTGNEIGCLLLHYVLSGRKEKGTLSNTPVAVSTIVSTPMTQRIADAFGCEMRYVLTGFKYIGEQVSDLVNHDRADDFVLGFEESIGYMVGTHCRDKDAVVASMLICEMAAYYHKQGKSLAQVMEDLYEEYGFYHGAMINMMFEGAQGMVAMGRLMSRLRSHAPMSIGGKNVFRISDYQISKSKDLMTLKETKLTLPKSNVLIFDLEGNNRVIFRPSGTEPKVKSYITAVGKTKEEAAALAETLRASAEKLMKE